MVATTAGSRPEAPAYAAVGMAVQITPKGMAQTVRVSQKSVAGVNDRASGNASRPIPWANPASAKELDGLPDADSRRTPIAKRAAQEAAPSASTGPKTIFGKCPLTEFGLSTHPSPSNAKTVPSHSRPVGLSPKIIRNGKATTGAEAISKATSPTGAF